MVVGTWKSIFLGLAKGLNDLLAVFQLDFLELLETPKVRKPGFVDTRVGSIHLGNLIPPEVADGQGVVVFQWDGGTFPSHRSATSLNER